MGSERSIVTINGHGSPKGVIPQEKSAGGTEQVKQTTQRGERGARRMGGGATKGFVKAGAAREPSWILARGNEGGEVALLQGSSV